MMSIANGKMTMTLEYADPGDARQAWQLITKGIGAGARVDMFDAMREIPVGMHPWVNKPVPVRGWRRLAWWRRRETYRERWARMGIERYSMGVVRVKVSQGLTMGKR